MSRSLAAHFAMGWLDAWHAHDMPRALAHYTDDFEMSSPVIIQMTGNPAGRLQGKPTGMAAFMDNDERAA